MSDTDIAEAEAPPQQRRGRGKEPRQITEQMRKQVESMTGYGIGQIEIARLLVMDVKTLRKYFRDELDTGSTRANTLMAEALWKNGVRHNNVQAQIWWTKARMGWKDQTQVNVGGADKPVAIEFTWAPAAATQAVAHETKDAPPVIDATPEPTSTDDTEFVWGKSTDDTS